MNEVTDPRIEAIIEANTVLHPDLDAPEVGPRQNQKIKLLKIMEILRAQSGPGHPMTTSQLVSALIAQGISSERRTLAKDIAALNEYGYEIMSVNVGRERGYYINKPENEASAAEGCDLPAVSAVLQFEESFKGAVCEKFGAGTPMLEIDEGKYIATVTVPADPALWKWLLSNSARSSFVLK